MPAISFQSVTKTYASSRGPFKALDGVSFDIAQGEFFGLLGPNGAGKTTLISILAGLVRATSGRVLVHGNDVEVPGQRGDVAAEVRPTGRAGAATVQQHHRLVVALAGLVVVQPHIAISGPDVGIARR